MQYYIQGTRWFQRSAGNTYHKARIYTVHGELLWDSGRHYGYGEGFLQTAWEGLQHLGIVPKDDEYGGTLKLREKYGIPYTVADVGRQKDL